ncbi:paraquat-inducible protein A [Shewanella insulae]|uniref:paraquat-inducible protein A n=1 Tax=Shewanella insulae TaxID=2681496 RepID=UPI001EFCA819|nr:paraquat-inducible protein A [Shewanella insulae]MCG9713806.1 paraquat-inducible protein A [Shewanella insulae]MCG9754445.1 paraquat-inducible protein A [Shewanella insulae]
MSQRSKWPQLLVIMIALALLIPGLSLPMLSLDGQADKSKFAQTSIELMTEDGEMRGLLGSVSAFLGFNQLEGQVEIYRKHRSILGTVQDLMQSGNLLVGILIATFSVIIPTLKLLAQAVLVFTRGSTANLLMRFIDAIGKWSMADVFVVAIIVSYLAGNAEDQMGELIIMHAKLEIGFWFFTGYCLFAIASNMLMTKPKQTAT